MMTVILIVGVGDPISTADLKPYTDTDLVVVGQDFEPTKIPQIPDMGYELDYDALIDPKMSAREYVFVVKSKINPFKSICEWHYLLFRQLYGGHRKSIYWKRIRSRTWTKCRKVNASQVDGVIQLIILIAIIIQL